MLALRSVVGWIAVHGLAVALSAIPQTVRADGAGGSQGTQESCLDCHSSPDFLVTNRKLYAYFQEWTGSVHAQEGVTCSDCHGGNPEATDAATAHGREVAGGSVAGSAVSFQNVPETCGTCHDSIYSAYQESDHFDHLLRKKQDKQGPNCVTCHGSLNVTVLNVTTVRKTCEQCHNEGTNNHPDIPERAEKILNDFLSIHRYYRYIGIRVRPEDARSFFEKVDARTDKLSELWHTFELPKVEKETTALVEFMKAKRAEVRGKRKEDEPKP